MARDIIFAIDVEPDGRVDVGDNWAGTHRTFAELTRLREVFESRTGASAQFNWFVRCDTQIEKTWNDAGYVETACPDLIRFLKTGSDFCGIHTHFLRWDEAGKRWYNAFSDAAWCDQCLVDSLQAFTKMLGYRPQGSRFGDRWCSNALVARLRSEGIRYELTLEPGVVAEPIYDDPHATLWMPDYRRAPRLPYRPSAADYLTPDPNPAAGALWMVPLTATPAQWTRVRRFPWVMKNTCALNLVLWPERLWSFLDAELSSQRTEPLSVASAHAEPVSLVMRSGDLAAPQFLKNFRYVTDRLAAHPGLRDVRFSRVDDAVGRFEGQTFGVASGR